MLILDTQKIYNQLSEAIKNIDGSTERENLIILTKNSPVNVHLYITGLNFFHHQEINMNVKLAFAVPKSTNFSLSFGHTTHFCTIQKEAFP